MGVQSDKITVHIDEDLAEIVPGYLFNRRKDVDQQLPQALASGDFQTLRILGHRMKGSGAGYGFEGVSEIGRAIEEAAKLENRDGITQGIADLANYLDHLDVIYD
ncbi:MAG: Hpt domain-containing protein [Magnetococcales bacterium]|nr:Hpt domain-containing protein [Magnetococcales bacterium]MBF0438107.1 Hpt domain-containing protein [Magnetococcales bacterium]